LGYEILSDQDSFVAVSCWRKRRL